MAYKQSPLPMIQGTSGHRSALKQIADPKQKLSVTMPKDHPVIPPTGVGPSKKSTSTTPKVVEPKIVKKKTPKGTDPYAEAKKKDPNLDSYIKERKKHKPGSAEYEANQAKINAAYGKVRSKKLKAAQIKKVEAEAEEPKTTDVKTVTKVAEKVEAPVATSRKDTRKQKLKGKVAAKGKDTPGGTEITRAEQADIKVKKLTTKQETAVAEGKTRKAKRLAKRVSKRTIKAEKLTAKAAAREKGGGEISAADRKAIKTKKLERKLEGTAGSTTRKAKRLAKRVLKRGGDIAITKANNPFRPKTT